MLRAFLLVLGLGAAFSAGVYFGPQLQALLPPGVGPAPPSLRPAPVVKPGVRAGEIQSCRDDCEQRAVVYHLPESAMLSCIASCPFDPVAPRETPRSITRAPADHAPRR